LTCFVSPMFVSRSASLPNRSPTRRINEGTIPWLNFEGLIKAEADLARTWMNRSNRCIQWAQSDLLIEFRYWRLCRSNRHGRQECCGVIRNLLPVPCQMGLLRTFPLSSSGLKISASTNCLSQKHQCHIHACIGLRQHGGRCLVEDRVLGHIG
jgi:hypothetical protein